MDFGNERYVRLFVRDTTTWRRMSWEAQALAPQLLRLVDRSGVLDLSGYTPDEAVEAHLLKWPPEVVRAGLASLLEHGVLQHSGDTLVWPRFLDAQECRVSDAQRAKESRARRRDEARRAKAISPYQERRSVTERHTVSHGVTESHSSLPSEPAVLAVPADPASELALAERARAREGLRLEGFERFWEAYPKRSGKEAARRAWAELDCESNADAIVAAVEAQKHHGCQLNADAVGGLRYVRGAKRWLEERNWEDEPQVVAPDSKATSLTDRNMAVLAQVQREESGS